MGYERLCCEAEVGFLERSPSSLLALQGMSEISKSLLLSNFAVGSARVQWFLPTRLNGDVSPHNFNLSLGLLLT